MVTLRTTGAFGCVAQVLAASPLEDLVSEHGPGFIDRVEQRALENRKFRPLLGDYPLS